MSAVDEPAWPSFDAVRLETARLVLRPFTADDAPALLRIFSNAEVARYGITPAWETLDDALAYLETDREQRAGGEGLRLAIERRADGALVGSCVLFAFERPSRRAELGYSLERAAWGRGYAREAVGRLLDFGFDVLGLNRIEADIDTRNRASERVLDHFGFRHEGLLRERWIVAGEVSDSAILALLASQRKASVTG